MTLSLCNDTNLSLFMQQYLFQNLNPNPQAPVVRKVDSAIQWLNHYPVDSAIGFLNTYRLDSDLSSG